MIYLFQFLEFSFYAALISSLVTKVITYFKLTIIFNKDIEEYNNFKEFNNKIIKHIIEKNSLSRQILNILLYFVPGHAIMLNCAFIYWMLRYNGSYGIIKGIIASEQLSFIPLIKFKIIRFYK